MNLEARSPSCFSDSYVLKLDGRPYGEFHGRWFSEDIDVRLVRQQRLHFRKSGWMGSHFVLTDVSEDRVLGQADRSGLFTSAWDLTLSVGPAELVSAGVFNTGFVLTQGGHTRAETDRIGICEGGWFVRDYGTLKETDLLFIGLVYRTILKRRAAAAASTSAT